MNENFEILYNTHVRKIYKFFYYRINSKETSEDLTSRTFVKALEKINTYNSQKGSFSSWIYTIARNNLIDYYRKNRYSEDIDNVLGIKDKSDFVRDVDARNQLKKIRKYLEVLTEEQRNIVLMRVWDDLSFKEIAEIVGKSEVSCKMMFSRTIARIRKEFPFALLLLVIIKLIN